MLNQGEIFQGYRKRIICSLLVSSKIPSIHAKSLCCIATSLQIILSASLSVKNKVEIWTSVYIIDL